MITRKQKTILYDTWHAIRHELSTIDWTDYGGKLLELTLEESKAHDRFRGMSIKRGMTIQEEAKYFAVKRLYEYCNGGELSSVDYLMTQRSCYAAFCIMHHERFKAQTNRFILNCFKRMQEIASWDYSDLIDENIICEGYQLDNRRGCKLKETSLSD